MKFLSFTTILMFNLFIPLSVWIFYGLIAKFVSIVVLSLQIIILNDSILVFCEMLVIPFRESGKCGMITTIIIGYVIPLIINISIFLYNFIVYTPICTPYLLINTIILMAITILIVVNLMRLRNVAGPMIATLWFTLFIGILNNSMLSSTPHSSCQVLQTDGTYSTSVQYGDTIVDSLLSFFLLTIMFLFLCVMTKKDAKKYSYYVESWFYFFVLREVGNSYMKYAPKRPIASRPNNKRIVEMDDLSKKEDEGEEAGGGNLERVMRDIVDNQVVRKLAAGNYMIPNDFNPDRVRFRSKQAFFFHLLMSLFGAYTAVIFTSWIHITIDDVTTGADVYDNTSLWSRFIGILLGILLSMIKVFRAHHHYSKLREDQDAFRSDEESNDN